MLAVMKYCYEIYQLSDYLCQKNDSFVLGSFSVINLVRQVV